MALDGAGSVEEPKVAYNEIPKDLKGFAQKEFKQKNDGKIASLLTLDVAGKSISNTATTFFSENSGTLFYKGDDFFVVTYGNVNAKVNPAGELSLFELGNSYNYGIGTSRDNSVILTGGLRNLCITTVDTMAAGKGEIDKIDGWPEYWKGFSGTDDGSALYGGTSAYRVAKIGADGAVLKKTEGH